MASKTRTAFPVPSGKSGKSELEPKLEGKKKKLLLLDPLPQLLPPPDITPCAAHGGRHTYTRNKIHWIHMTKGLLIERGSLFLENHEFENDVMDFRDFGNF
jgi:hypothetical protein